MKQKRFITVSVCLIAALLLSVVSASAAVYVQNGNFKYQVFDDNTVAWAGYISDTVDDVVVPRYYDQRTVVSVANFAMENNSSIRSIDFMEAPDLERIGMYAFYKCSSLESVLVPDSITDVDVSAFRECTSLTDVTFYGNQKSVPVEAFCDCSALTTVRLSASLRSIQSRAFAGCTSLAYLELYDTVTYIAPNAFDGDQNLTLGVYYGTYAYQYAKDNSIPFVLLDEVLLGDANADGKVNINDVTAIQRHLAELEALNDLQLKAADIDGSNEVQVSDATLVQSYLAEFEIAYPINTIIA